MDPTWLESPLNVFGSATLAERLRQSLHAFDKLGAPLPGSGRHYSALRLLDAVNADPDNLDATSDTQLERLAAAHRDAHELFVIAYAAVQCRTRHRTPFTISRLRAVGAGGVSGDGSNPYPRNIQFELFLASYLTLGGLNVMDGEPDLLLEYAGDTVGVACKRVRSLSPDQVAKNFGDGVDQILRQERRGFVALSIEPHFSRLPVGALGAEHSAAMSACFDTALRKATRYSRHPEILGYLALGRTAGWLPDPNNHNKPGLNTTTPFRWHGWTSSAEEDNAYKDIVMPWHARLDAALSRLASKEPL